MLLNILQSTSLSVCSGSSILMFPFSMIICPSFLSLHGTASFTNFCPAALFSFVQFMNVWRFIPCVRANAVLFVPAFCHSAVNASFSSLLYFRYFIVHSLPVKCTAFHFCFSGVPVLTLTNILLYNLAMWHNLL